MLGEFDFSDKRVSVVGGGFSGLLSAYYLDRAGFEVSLFEATSRFGGLIKTEQTPWGLSESAAHSIMVSPEVQKLFSELNISTYSVNPDSNGKYIFRQNRFRKFPLTFLETLKAILRAISIRAKIPEEEMLLGDWVDLHLGSAVRRYLFAPMIHGIYGVRPNELVVGAAYPSLVVPKGRSLVSHLFSKKNSDQKRKRSSPIRVPVGGMESLIQALVQHLSTRLENRIFLNRPIQDLNELPRGNRVVTVPALVAGALLETEDRELACQLRTLPYTPLMTVKVFVSKSQLKLEPKGLGVLVAEGESLSCLGVLFNSAAFDGRAASDDQVSLSLFFGGTSRPEALALSDENVIEEVVLVLGKLFGFEGQLAGVRIDRHGRAVPQYGRQAMAVWELAKKGWCSKPGNILFGNYTGQVSLRGMIETWERKFLS
ncbi:MAG: protoporphyrinogen oxidase [Bdellovibrio sp.]|nr:protoporphyrinogen oxidase [Bdellovibrio sp.]